MTLLRITIIVSIFAALGCTSANPRYGAGEPRPANRESNVKSHRTINSTISFGRILQVYLGKPYAGRSKYDPGMDCSLFTGEVFKKYAKIDLPRQTDEQFKVGDPVKGGQIVFGDLVFFNTDSRGVSHVGVYVGHNEFIHASTSSGIIISDLKEKYWSKRFMGARRVIK